MKWNCAGCDKTEDRPPSKAAKRFCMPCRNRNYAGGGNPNFRDAAKRVCAWCGGFFSSYQKERKFCSQACYVDSRPKKMLRTQIALQLRQPAAEKAPKTPRAPDTPPAPIERRPKPPSKKLETVCAHCRNTFLRYPSAKRLFCSYKCHLDSGGAFRAGVAASKAKQMYGPKRDANHNEIFGELQKHCPAYDLSAHGYGLPDGIAWVMEEWRLFEVKNPKTSYGKKGLNKVQKKWLSQWKGGPVYMIYTVDEAKRHPASSRARARICASGLPVDGRVRRRRCGAGGRAAGRAAGALRAGADVSLKPSRLSRPRAKPHLWQQMAPNRFGAWRLVWWCSRGDAGGAVGIGESPAVAYAHWLAGHLGLPRVKGAYEP